MRITGKTPNSVKKIYITGSQNTSTFHFDDSQGPPKDGMWFHVKGSSAAGDAAASSVARETAISFSPPPQRAPARPSNVPRKRKERVAELADDDDDFVSFPPRPSASSSKATRVAVGKTKKSKSSHSVPKHSEGVQNPSKRTNPNYRSAPNKVVEAIKSLNDRQKVEIRDYPFGSLLDLKLRGLENTKLLVFLMDRLDPDTLTLDIGNDKPLKITRHSIQCVFGLPNRGKRIAAPDKHKQKEALSNLKRKLGIEPGVDVKVQDLITWLKKGDIDPFSVRCFIMVLLSKLLVPGTSDFITGKEAALTEDMSTLCLVNWASFIFDDIAIAAKLWRSKKSCTNPSMHECLMFLLVYYLNNLLGEHSTDPELTPRIAHVTKQQILDLIEEYKQVVNGVETFGALPLRIQQGTCYMENTSSSTYDPTETQATDIPSASHSFPCTFFPSMQHHLAGCFNHLPAEDQIAANDALRRCDEDVGKLTLQISTTQMSAIQEIRRILCSGQSRTRPPSPPDGRGTENPVTTDTPLRATHTDTSMEASQQRQPPSPCAADEPNVLLHKGRNIEEDNDVTYALSFTQIIMGDGFDKLSSTQQADFIDGVFGDPNRPPYNSHHHPNYDSPHESPYDSPQESHYGSPHEILTNDDICQPDEDLLNDEGDADTLALDEVIATVQEENEPITNIISSTTGDTVVCLDTGSGIRPQVDADVVGQMASPRTPQNFRPPKNIITDPSFQGLHNESSPLHPPVFDKTPHHHGSTPSVDGTEHVTQSWEVSQQLRDAGLQKTDSWNKSDVCVKKTTTKISRPKISTCSSKVSYSRNSRNKVLHSRIVYYGTQPPKTSRRNKHMSSKLLSPFKSPPNKAACHIPLDSALALRDIIISDKRLMDSGGVPLISNASLGVCSRGEALASSFKDNASTLIEIMNFFTECLRHDENLLASQCRGYRLFLSWTFGSLLNCKELLPGQVYDGSMAIKYLSEHLNGVDPKQIKLILWTYHHSNHFSVYCVNRVNTRIDVLDSIDWIKNGGSFEERNDPCGYRSIERLSDAFQTLTGKQFEDFSKWPIWSNEVPRQLPLGNSCASFTKKFLRHYDGEESLLRCSIEPSKENQYRAEDLSYLIFYDLNQIRPLPDSIEKFRPMLIHM